MLAEYCALVHMIFWKQPGCALIGACVLIEQILYLLMFSFCCFFFFLILEQILDHQVKPTKPGKEISSERRNEYLDDAKMFGKSLAETLNDPEGL